MGDDRKKQRALNSNSALFSEVRVALTLFHDAVNHVSDKISLQIRNLNIAAVLPFLVSKGRQIQDSKKVWCCVALIVRECES